MRRHCPQCAEPLYFTDPPLPREHVACPVCSHFFAVERPLRTAPEVLCCLCGGAMRHFKYMRAFGCNECDRVTYG